MIKHSFFSILILMLFCGCHKSYDVQGTVTDKVTGEPVYDARVALKKIDTTFTDSLGHFEFNEYLTGGYAFSDVEILVEKKGFKAQYINVTKTGKNSGSLTTYLERKENTNSLPKEGVKLFYLINLAVSVMNFVTILFILFNRIRYKSFWILGIIFINWVFNIIYIDGSIDFDFFHEPFFIFHYIYSPFTIKLVIPIVSVFFWILYIKRIIGVNPVDFDRKSLSRSI